MKTIVLDDDPTGTQSAKGVEVVLVPDEHALTGALRESDSVYVQTNSRALDETTAVALLEEISRQARSAARQLGERVRFVLRGDSTLRGHVFAETNVFLDEDAVMVFVPAFPDGGRFTRGGVHYATIDGFETPVHLTEYAEDPVFPFDTSDLVEYVARKSGRDTLRIGRAELHDGKLASLLATAAPGTVLVPDAQDEQDLEAIATAIELVGAGGRSIVTRCASPLAALLAGVRSDGLLSAEQLGRLTPSGARLLLACGSHTRGATHQIEAFAHRYLEPVALSTGAAFDDPDAEGLRAADDARGRSRDGLLALMTDRHRAPEHNTLRHGEQVMAALTSAVRALVPHADVVVSKGGITSADIARTGLGAVSARVEGQILTGVSVWTLESFDGRRLTYVVVPGNVGARDTLVEIAERLLGQDRPLPAESDSMPS